MWYGVRISPNSDPEFVSVVAELSRSTLRSLILSTVGISLVWYLAALVAIRRTSAVSGAFFITIFVILTSLLALRIARTRVLVAQSVWLIGLAGAITLALYWFRQPEIAFLYALLPLLATVTAGWPAGLLSEILLIALLWWLSYGRSAPVPLASYGIGIILGGAVTGVLGWAVARSFLNVTLWSVFSYDRARVLMDEALDQKADLKQTREDLIQANQELARLSDRLKAMRQIAEEARQAKEEFVANVSHELRTPLNMIIGFSEMITQSPQVYGVELPPPLLADVTAIQRNSRHLARLVDDVLDLSQVEAGRMALSKEWMSLEKIIDEAALAVGALFASKRLYLEKRVPSDLPRVFCDSTRIYQVLLNLLSNAGRFTERGGIHIKAWSETDDVLVAVSDTGPGIALEDQDKLFEPFSQLDRSMGPDQGGSGLGLSISKRFVEMHGGRMWLESKVGAGTTFCFNLPLQRSIPISHDDGDARRWFHSDRQYEERTRRSKAPAPQVTPRVLVLEAGDALQQLFTRYVDGVEIISVQDIEQAERELSRTPAEALIVNASPFGEAPASRAQLANLPYRTPAVTCWVPGLDEAATRLGVARYLVKPVTRELLLESMQGLGVDVRTVLLVDDSSEVLQLFTRMLASQEHGYRVLQTTSGRRALSLLRERRPDVMLLDLIMPDVDGFQVLQEKFQDDSIRDIPVVVISSRDPAGEPIVSDSLAVTRGGGLSMRDILACIQAVSAILSPTAQPDGRALREKSAA